MKQLRHLLPIVVFTAILGSGNPAFAVTKAEIGKRMLELKFVTINGQKIDTTRLKGKVVMIDIWATWCPPCRMEIPHLQKLYDSYKGRGFRLIGVSLGEGKEKPANYARDAKLNYDIAYTNPKEAAALGAKLDVGSIPSTYLIDKKGILRLVEVGFNEDKTPAKLEESVKRLLAAK